MTRRNRNGTSGVSASWPAPGFAKLEGTWIGDLDSCLLEGGGGPDDGDCPGTGPLLSDIADGYQYLPD